MGVRSGDEVKGGGQCSRDAEEKEEEEKNFSANGIGERPGLISSPPKETAAKGGVGVGERGGLPTKKQSGVKERTEALGENWPSLNVVKKDRYGQR